MLINILKVRFSNTGRKLKITTVQVVSICLKGPARPSPNPVAVVVVFVWKVHDGYLLSLRAANSLLLEVQSFFSSLFMCHTLKLWTKIFCLIFLSFTPTHEMAEAGFGFIIYSITIQIQTLKKISSVFCYRVLSESLLIVFGGFFWIYWHHLKWWLSTCRRGFGEEWVGPVNTSAPNYICVGSKCSLFACYSKIAFN